MHLQRWGRGTVWASARGVLEQTLRRGEGLKSVIPALWEAEVGGSQGQEIETILVNVVKPCIY